QPQSVQWWATRADVTEHEAEHRQTGEVDVVGVAAEGDVVSEYGGHLGRVRHATDPGECRDVVERAAFVRLHAEVIAEPRRDAPRAQHVFHGQAHPEIGGEGERGDELGQLHARVS